MKLQDYDFDLPPGLVAQYPARERDQSRLLVLDRASGSLRHARFAAILDYMRPGDVLVLNHTRVFPARLRGVRADTGGRIELLLVRRQSSGWLAMGRPGRSLKPGVEMVFGEGRVRGQVLERAGEGRVCVRLVPDEDALLEQVGELPLPPYIRRAPEAADRQRYQTVYALQSGAVAAPTAGLHFTPDLLERIRERGVEVAPVLLHVGPGTFEPVRSEDPREHRLEAEYYEVGEQSAAAIERCRRAGGRVLAVGTTVVRTLETVAAEGGQVLAGSGFSAKFIYPPYAFRAVDALLTNFHLPRSSLLLLVAAFAGRERLLAAYAEAIDQGYRFYSYGDAMLIL